MNLFLKYIILNPVAAGLAFAFIGYLAYGWVGAIVAAPVGYIGLELAKGVK